MKTVVSGDQLPGCDLKRKADESNQLVESLALSIDLAVQSLNLLAQLIGDLVDLAVRSLNLLAQLTGDLVDLPVQSIDLPVQ